MKKVKIMLTAITVAVISGALAFKAHKFGGPFYCSIVSGTAGNCIGSYSQNVNEAAMYCTVVSHDMVVYEGQQQYRYCQMLNEQYLIIILAKG